MKEFVISEVKTETAVLVGLITKDQDEAKTKEYLDELEFLADTAGAVTVKRFTQRVGGPSQVTYVGSGKLEEIKQYIEDEEEAEPSWYGYIRRRTFGKTDTQYRKRTWRQDSRPYIAYSRHICYASTNRSR